MNIIRRSHFLICAVLLHTATLSAQDFIGFTTSNYAGVNKVHYNPASIADSRFKVDISLFGMSTFIGNNYIGLDRTALFNPDRFQDPDFADKYLLRADNKKAYNAYVGLNLQLPSFMVTLTPKDAIAFTARLRSITNVNGVEQPFLDLAWESFKFIPNWNRQFSQKRLEVQTNTWTEYGFSYGRVILDKKEHFLKGGITLKILQGLGSAYLFGKDVEYNFTNSDTLSIFNADISYGHSDNFTLEGLNNFSYKFVANPTVGFDIGFEYEWRPKYADYQYEMDGKSELWRRDKNKYKLKAGFAITDIGGTRYEKGGESNSFKANVNSMPTSVFNNVRDVETLDSTFNSIFTTSADDNRKFRMGLPTMLSLQVDYNVWKGFYLNFSPFISLTSGRRDDTKTRMWNNYALTPRYEMKWFGVYLPNSYNTLTGYNSGISLRLGPLVLGSGTIFSSLGKKALREADFHMLLKIPVPYGKPRDRDRDKVSDRKDKCRDLAGVWEFKGCPDTDGDGLQDTEDECPTDPGPKELRGCPDRDGDGITDKTDGCPDEAGPADLNGCPDRDSDGIIDNKDDCPDERGLAEFNGCPDADGDGVMDKLDQCPTLPGPPEKFGCPDRDGDGVTDDKDACPDEPGLAENSGCPFKDTDKDGIRDTDDKCPTQPGPIENGGCPYADTDADGIIDLEDKCPNTPGVKENFGCPPIAKEEQEVIQAAFDNLEFATGKAIIRSTSYPSLDGLAELLKKKSDYKLLIEGHTDNVGQRQSNITLSKNRSTAVKTYLMKKGVPESRLLTKWYGPDKPIDTNDTEEGRQRNRRVEMTIVFE
jgi:outer membrane protein OmpA-like peptidoglycan-associated protein